MRTLDDWAGLCLLEKKYRYVC